MIKKMKKTIFMVVLCSALMLGSSMTVFAGGGEDVEEPMTEPIFTETVEEETEEEPVAFTPDGNAELVDEATDEDEKLFYTFVTKNDNYFYLVIDKARESDNVYMLNLIDEQDLMALMEEQEEGSTTKDTSQNEVSLKPESGIVEETEPETTAEEEAQTKPETSNSGNSSAVVLILLLVIGGGAAGVFYYLKFVKGKKEDFKLEDDLDFYDDEDYVNEDEVAERVEGTADDNVGEEETEDSEEDIL